MWKNSHVKFGDFFSFVFIYMEKLVIKFKCDYQLDVRNKERKIRNFTKIYDASCANKVF
jgi:hypothetical protein